MLLIFIANALIEPELGMIFWTFLTFGLLLIVLRKVAWGPIITGLRERETSIDNALSEAQRAREEIRHLSAQNEQLLVEARAERDRMLREAKEMREKIISDSKISAQEEGRKMITLAKESIEKEKIAAMRQLREQVVILSMDAAKKILKSELQNPDSQEKLVTEYLKDSTDTAAQN